MAIPSIGPDGVRQTINAGLNPLEAVWNFRSGWNVAALNCLEPRNQQILEGYKAFLEKNAKRLRSINKELDREYRRNYGSSATRERETHMTQVYNYFALPPAHAYFCDAALQISQEALLSPPGDVDAFALAALPRLEAAFERFYRDYEHYRIAVADWDARYGALYGPSRRGVVFANAVADDASEGDGRVQLSADVQETETVSQPVVQPVQ